MGTVKKIWAILENFYPCGKFPKKCFSLKIVILATYDHFFILVLFSIVFKLDAALSEIEDHLRFKFCANWVVFTTPKVPPNLSKALQNRTYDF